MSDRRHNSVAPDVAIVIGSHGALEAAGCILSRLPRRFEAPVFLHLHRNSDPCLAPDILARRTELPLLLAADGLLFEPRAIYLAPSDGGLMLNETTFVALPGRHAVHRWHRGVDMMLSAAAQAFGSRLIAVVLSGQLDGGALGACAVKAYGGWVLAQDPQTAIAPAMPRAALATGCVDFALPPDSLGDALVALSAAPGTTELFRRRRSSIAVAG